MKISDRLVHNDTFKLPIPCNNFPKQIPKAIAEQKSFHLKVHKSKFYHKFLLTGIKPWSLEHLVRTADMTPCVLKETLLFTQQVS